MTITRLLIALLFEWAVLALLKVIFLNHNLLQTDQGIYLYLILTAVISAAIIRRVGYINYLEAGVASLVWLTFVGFLDYIITNQFLSAPAFSHNHVWLAYLIIVLAILFFASIGNSGLVLGFTAGLVLLLLIDAAFGSRLKAADLSYEKQIWIANGIMMLSVIIFHKKRHVAIRRGEFEETGHH